MTSPLRVLQVIEATEGGTRRHLNQLVTHLDPARFAVSVACSTRRDPAFMDDLNRMRARGIPVYVVPMRRAIHPLNDALALIRLAGIMRREQFDIVHTHSAKAGFVGRVAAQWVGVPRILHTPHTFPFDMQVNALVRYGYRHLEHLAARCCHGIVCVCPSQLPAAERLIGHGRATVVENGIEPAPVTDNNARERQRRQLNLGPSELAVGFIGRFVRQKGPLDFVEATRRVAVQQPRAQFILVGDGALRPQIEQTIHAAGLENRCRLVGSQTDVPDYLAAFDLVVLPSRWEGLPYVLLESLRAGRAVVASRVGGMADVLRDGVNGILVPPGDPVTLAAAISKVLENDALRAMMGTCARETITHRYRLEDMMTALMKLYEAR